MVAICKESSSYEGCTFDKNFRGIPDPDAETKIVALLFEYKNIGNTTSEASLRFSVVFEEEFIEIDNYVVPRDLIGKKLLPNAKSRSYVYVSVPDYFDMEDALLYFEAFDEPWKQGDDKWGLFTVERKARYVVRSLYPSSLWDAGTFTDADAPLTMHSDEVLDLERALEALHHQSPDIAEIVILRFIAGCRKARAAELRMPPLMVNW